MAFSAKQKQEKTRRFPHRLIVFGPKFPQPQGGECLGSWLASSSCGQGWGWGDWGSLRRCQVQGSLSWSPRLRCKREGLTSISSDLVCSFWSIQPQPPERNPQHRKNWRGGREGPDGGWGLLVHHQGARPSSPRVTRRPQSPQDTSARGNLASKKRRIITQVHSAQSLPDRPKAARKRLERRACLSEGAPAAGAAWGARRERAAVRWASLSRAVVDLDGW